MRKDTGMNIEANDISIRQMNDKWVVRISIGDYMYFDSPLTTETNALVIYDNLVGRT